MELQDSGNRREFSTGAVRDAVDGKGRCDLLPLGIIADVLEIPILHLIDVFIRDGSSVYIESVIKEFIEKEYNGDKYTTVLELAKHYEDGAKKYAVRNWEKGIPLHDYIDSGVRHLLKYYHGDTDEPHNRAFLWNMFGLLWTMRNKTSDQDLWDLPFVEERKSSIDRADNRKQRTT